MSSSFAWPTVLFKVTRRRGIFCKRLALQPAELLRKTADQPAAHVRLRLGHLRFGQLTKDDGNDRSLALGVGANGQAAMVPRQRFFTGRGRHGVAGDLFEDFFTLIVRDGAGLLKVDIRLVKALASVAEISPELFGAHCREHAALVVKRADAVLVLDDEKARLRGLVAGLL